MSNFPCYVTLANNTDQTLTLATSNAEDGSWSALPQTIGPESTGTIEIDDPPVIPEGSQGTCTYQVGEDQVFVTMSFSDPYSGSNTASGYINGSGPVGSYDLSFAGASGSPDNPTPNGVPSSGHPVWVFYTLTSA